MSVSQFGEHEVLEALFREIGTTDKYLVDVGALGKMFSNTWEFLAAGWKGVVIDADPQRMDLIRNEFAGLDVEVLHSGVSDEDGELDFHLHNAIGHNSFLKDWYPQTDAGKSVRVKVRPLGDILAERGVLQCFDLLSVDTEGFDERIMKALFGKTSYRPRVVVTECTSYSNPDELFRGQGYSLYRKTGNPQYGNLIYVRR